MPQTFRSMIITDHTERLGYRDRVQVTRKSPALLDNASPDAYTVGRAPTPHVNEYSVNYLFYAVSNNNERKKASTPPEPYTEDFMNTSEIECAEDMLGSDIAPVNSVSAAPNDWVVQHLSLDGPKADEKFRDIHGEPMGTILVDFNQLTAGNSKRKLPESLRDAGNEFRSRTLPALRAGLVLLRDTPDKDLFNVSNYVSSPSARGIHSMHPKNRIGTRPVEVVLTILSVLLGNSKMFPAALVSLCLAVTYGQQICTQLAEAHPVLTTQQCAANEECTTLQTSVILDSNWPWTHQTTRHHQLLHRKHLLCPDPVTCVENCALDGANYEARKRGKKRASANSSRQGATMGSPPEPTLVPAFTSWPPTQYQLFQLLSQEFTFTIDMSHLGCGLNGALYLTGVLSMFIFLSQNLALNNPEMDADGGVSKYPNNKTGAQYGVGYCDSQVFPL
ncbi:concanavalin A-like lectin/glucanase domain-containing protein [Mycena maculata]|uniref:Glucanase n=1 Tax=Mycena maculata TaxID=230809 RepID=A0AAD7P2L7_9AGAR|nr:concanavalin A-like lectin/glucanase domain-containing protein [Mycena maculata]